jgi:hypothetical protein
MDRNLHVYLFLIALVYLIGRNILDTLTIQKLTNKLMSRNYYDYQLSDHLPKTMHQEGKNTLKEGMQIEEDLKEDLSPVTHFL